MRVFKVRGFARFQRKERIRDETLASALREIERGLVDADLGGGLVKKRVARAGEGKRGGYRTLIAYRRGSRAVFLFGFAKNDLDNVDDDGLDELRQLARRYLGLNEQQTAALIAANELTEVPYGEGD